MSGDVQVRKRKDKKRKRDSIDPKSEGDVLSRKLSVEEDEDPKEHHGVHATKMGTDDVHLHVQADHETGGHWCAKIFFFSLLAILLGLIGLIIMENRGLSDLDTPLSESRFSEYFEGWVDEHRAHDDHNVDKVVAEHDGAFDEEEEEHTELDDDHELESEPDEDHEDEEEDAEQQDEGVGEEEGSEEEAEANLEEENDAGAEDEDEEETYHSRSKRSAPEDDEDEEEEEQQNDEDEEEEDADKKSDDDDEADEGFGEGDNEEDDQADDEQDTVKDNSQKPSYNSDPFDEEDNFDDDDDEPPVDIVENDDGEMLHLQQKKAQEEPEEGGTSKEGFSSSQVKSRGPQSAYDEDAFLEEELRRANEELLQNQYDFQ